MSRTPFSGQHLAGKLLRLPFRLLPSSMQVPILGTRMRGKKWIVGSGVHGFWLGLYELKKRKLFEQLITMDSVVWDIGAHVGFYTLLSSVLVGASGKVFAFEPHPRNVGFLKKHLEINRITNVEVIQAAVSNKDGISILKEGPTSSENLLDPDGTLKVRTVALDTLLERNEILEPDTIKIDVEGGEKEVLEEAVQLLEERHPTLFLSVHSPELREWSARFLTKIGYRLKPIDHTQLSKAYELLALRP